jgi:AcrR family transcriptional regulator
MADRVKRRYDSSRRKAAARATAAAILAAAHDLFVERGYGRTTIADIAAAAGVAPETIYATIGNKPTLLRRVWDVTIGGDDDDIPFHERPEIRAIRDEPDLALRFRMHAAMYTRTARRTAPFLLALAGAAAAEPTAAEMLTEVSQQRLVGMSVMACDAAATGRLAVSEEVCRDIVWSMTDGTLWHRLVNERGWTDEEFADWLARTWVATIVTPPTPAGPEPAPTPAM